jgi:hypothetical protein
MSKPKSNGCLAGGIKQQKKISHREYLRRLRKTVVTTFQTNHFNLEQLAAEKCADKIMKVVERNYRRARSAGLI